MVSVQRGAYNGGNFYITTTLPYVNADPHIGFAMEIVQADIIARYQRMLGREVFFNTGTDEHGQKISDAAKEAGTLPQTYVDGYAEQFSILKNKDRGLNVSWTNFIRTSSPEHKAAAQEFWRRCLDAGDIYKKKYQTKYCVGCELEKTDSELEGGKCSIHPNLSIQLIDEENYFFRFSKYQDPLRALYESRMDFVVPDFRFNEIKSFVSRGLQDFSISRLKSKMSWGVPVPDDSEQVIYVWFDALVSYISTLGWPHDIDNFKKWWVETGGVVQFAGKDQIRMQAAMWQAMLMSAQSASPEKELIASKQIVIHGFITSGGQKMSKSLGNVINPFDLVKEYGTDAVRYFLAREVSFFEDSDVTVERFKEAYNANLANGLGNLVSRILKMRSNYHVDVVIEKSEPSEVYTNAFLDLDPKKAADFVWEEIGNLDRLIAEREPFKKIKTDEVAAKKDIAMMVVKLYEIGVLLTPFLPATSEKILSLVQENKAPETPLFPRKE
ncbi:MAG: methionine--tRNA ligase [Candidatus Taylorbacteria bacterium RIFCSPHIGHO2_02_FULL_46_13]|uniref:Methionine--tRNA ligase n=1 Tax=Candidatus Taylorbacteria bacterium RIFCSPHIGHO2_02_FULL_46_13 TaxID=1802312 RepID=A0A1G2MTZ8_9BACT|nr:MAG: methionine--tRNA ligase [Candidatus Taylorbacteria bacterium RIFCSPHIGHO2_02_FULL_46_13]